MISVAANKKGIFFSYSTAQKLGAKLDYCDKRIINDDEIISTLSGTSTNYLALTESYKTKITLLSEDKLALKTRGDKFEKVYTTCSADLNKCEDAKPSRYVWFSIGAISTLIATIATIFIIKK